jgi:hypothetical protein
VKLFGLLSRKGGGVIAPDGSGRAEKLGLTALALAAVPVFVLVWMPLSTSSAVLPVAAFHADAGLAQSFLNAAPFDTLRRRESSYGSLAEPSLPTVSDPHVIGGILINGSERKVMFSANPTVWQTEGTEVEGWLIRHIEPESIILTRGAEIKTPTYRNALEIMSTGPMGAGN